MRILFLSRWFPYPANNGSKVRIFALLRGLALRHSVSLLSFSDAPDLGNGLLELKSICNQVHVVTWKEYRPDSRHAKLGYLRLRPRSLVDTYSTDMTRQIESMLLSEHFDMVIGSQLNALSYAHAFGGLPALLEESELGVFHGQFTDTKSRSLRQRLRAGLTWFKLKPYMARQMKYFRAATVVSEKERQMLLSAAPNLKRIEVIPNCVTMADYADVNESPAPNNLIFTGPFRYPANHEAMTWFLRDVYPRIQREQPEVRLTITGDHAGLPLPAATNVTLTGYVDNVLPFISGAWCSIAPLRTGGGRRLKILEAMALGTPVVATSKGAEGLDVDDGVHLLIGDTPEAFASAVLSVLNEPGLRQRLIENGLQQVRSKYDWSKLMPRFLDLVDWAADV